jgi:uncharacterized protein (DUF58 family)
MTSAAEEASPVPAKLLHKVRRIEIMARRLVDHVFSGEYHSVFRGRGLEFSEVREYQPGDDVRIIDWNVTARMGTPYVKKFVEERDLTVLLAVDVSASESFGSAPQTKAEVAVELATLLALAAVRNNDRVGLIAFSDQVERFVPPRKGSQHVLRLVRELLHLRPQSQATDIATAVQFVSRIARRRSVVFLISDFLAAGYEATLRVAARRHDIIALALTDPREAELVPAGLVELADAETGERLLIDSDDPAVRQQYATGARRRREERRRLLGSLGVDEVDVRTDRSYVEPLMSFFRARSRRR